MWSCDYHITSVYCAQIAFVELNPFLSRSQLANQCQPHIELFKEEWVERERLKKLSREEASKRRPLPAVNTGSYLRNKQKKQLQWECACTLNEGMHTLLW